MTDCAHDWRSGPRKDVETCVECFQTRKRPKDPEAARLGRLGGLARAEALSPEERKAIARKGGRARQQRRLQRMLAQAKK